MIMPAAVVFFFFLLQIKQGDTGCEEMWGGWTVPALHKRAQMMLLKEANYVSSWSVSDDMPSC